jgi:cadmium resistance protein CadD (predicted permease)
VIVGAAATVYVATERRQLPGASTFFAHDGYTDAEIVLGQYLGIGLLIATSLPSARAALLLPHPVVGLLGLLPLGLGLRRLLARREGAPAVGPTDRRPRAARVFRVATAALANGGDNVATHVPFFAILTSIELACSLAVFAILVRTGTPGLLFGR